MHPSNTQRSRVRPSSIQTPTKKLTKAKHANHAAEQPQTAPKRFVSACLHVGLCLKPSTPIYTYVKYIYINCIDRTSTADWNTPKKHKTKKSEFGAAIKKKNRPHKLAQPKRQKRNTSSLRLPLRPKHDITIYQYQVSYIITCVTGTWAWPGRCTSSERHFFFFFFST